MKKKIICLGIISIFLLSTYASSTMIKTDNIITNQESTTTKIIELGKISIIDSEIKMDLDYDDLITIRDGTQQTMYRFVVDYEMKENSLDKEKWIFSLRLVGTITNSPKNSAYKKIEDKLGSTEKESGELWIEILGEDLWISNDNYLSIECKRWYCFLWLANFSYCDSLRKSIDLKTENFPSPKLEWTALDGTDYGTERVGGPYFGETKRKEFKLTNIGGWETGYIMVELDRGSGFSFLNWPGGSFSMQPGESKTFEVQFIPQHEGSSSATLRTENDCDFYRYWAPDPVEIELTGQGVNKRAKNKLSVLFSNRNISLKLFDKLFACL